MVFLFVAFGAVLLVFGIAQAMPLWTVCSLNGALNATGVCECNRPWVGTNCSLLARQPALPDAAYGVQPNASTWGGNVVRGTDDGLYHLFVVSRGL